MLTHSYCPKALSSKACSLGQQHLYHLGAFRKADTQALPTTTKLQLHLNKLPLSMYDMKVGEALFLSPRPNESHYLTPKR